MRLLASFTRATTCLVTLALLGASLAPCPQPGPRWQATAASAAEAGHPDCHRVEPERFLDAPCPCGCGEREPASPASRLGDALPGAVASLGVLHEGWMPVAGAPQAPAAPLVEIDHVPRIA